MQFELPQSVWKFHAVVHAIGNPDDPEMLTIAFVANPLAVTWSDAYSPAGSVELHDDETTDPLLTWHISIVADRAVVVVVVEVVVVPVVVTEPEAQGPPWTHTVTV